MTETETLTYFLFPHTTLSAGDFRNLGIFLPRLSVLEIARPAAIPEWGRERISGWPVLGSEELASRIGSCLERYRTFARVHGGPGGMLGFLNQALEEIDEPRYRIQEELRGKCRPDADITSTLSPELFRAALFLEMARELDEKELEIESGYTRLNAIEQEFREILGIEDDEPERAETNLTPALAPDTNGLLYMLPKRIGSWFQMLALKPPENMPVFVACFPEVIEEVVEMVRSECERDGKNLSTVTHVLGSIPGTDAPGEEQFPSLIDGLFSCRHNLEDFITRAAGGQDPAELESERRLLQSSFERLCQKCETPEGGKTNLVLTVVTNVSLSGVAGLPVLAASFEPRPLVFLTVTAGP